MFSVKCMAKKLDGLKQVSNVHIRKDAGSRWLCIPLLVACQNGRPNYNRNILQFCSVPI